MEILKFNLILLVFLLMTTEIFIDLILAPEEQIENIISRRHDER